MRLSGRHDVTPEERAQPKQFQIDVELGLDLAPAGRTDDLAQTADYSRVFALCREVVEDSQRKLLEAIAEVIAERVLVELPVDEVVVRVRKIAVPVPGSVAYSEVEISRTRRPGGR